MPRNRAALVAVALGVLAGLMMVTFLKSRVSRREYSASVPLARAYDFTPTYQQEQWFLATNALMTRRNGYRFDVLGGKNPTRENKEQAQRLLWDWWGIESHDGLLSTLHWLQEQGHRALFDSTMIALADSLRRSDLEHDAMSDPDLANEIAVVMAYGGEVGAESILAFDYTRFVGLCGWGYLAGYVSREEAWELIVPAGRLLQDTFDSWPEIGENYLIGRRFWSREETERNHQDYVDALEWLRSDPGSPWLQIPWDLDLQPPQ